MTPTHRALRDGTRDDHDRLDALFARFDLGDADSYAAFLAAHAQAVLPVEAALDAAGAAHLIADWESRKRGRAIVADLAALHHGVPAPASAPSFATNAAVLGAVYVVEGSRLGGRFLARAVAEGLPKSYLDAHQPPGNWPKLLADIDALLYSAGDVSEAVDSARDVFATFEAAGRHWLPKVG